MSPEQKIKRLELATSRLILAAVILISFGTVLGVVGYLSRVKKSTLPVYWPPLKLADKIEISDDKKSILNAETKETIFTIADTQKYLKDSGYEYNPNIFQNTDAKYGGGCFLGAAQSNRYGVDKKFSIVFSTGCLQENLSQPWIGVYDFSKIGIIYDDCIKYACAKDISDYCIKQNCIIPAKFKFLVSGSGRDFAWSQNDKTIIYETDLELSGITEKRVIDSVSGAVQKK